MAHMLASPIVDLLSSFIDFNDLQTNFDVA